MGADKRVILLLNKIDLVPRESVEEWLSYLRQELPALAFKSSTQQQASKLGHGKRSHGATEVSECLGADNLIQLLKNYSRSINIKTSITGELPARADPSSG